MRGNALHANDHHGECKNVRVVGPEKTTTIGQRVELTSVPTIQSVLRALQEQLHCKNMTHGELTPSRILQDNQGKIFFMGSSGCPSSSSGCPFSKPLHTNNLTPSSTAMQNNKKKKNTKEDGEDLCCSFKWSSFDAMLDRTVHELDDYEAVFTSALLETLELQHGEGGGGLPPEPTTTTTTTTSSLLKKRWAAWKLQLIDYVYSLFVTHASASSSSSSTSASVLSPSSSPSASSSSTISPALEFAVRGLMLVWTLPRTAERLNETQRENLVSLVDVDFQQHAATVRALFLSHLGRDKGDSSRVHLPLNDAREDFYSKDLLSRQRDGTETMKLSIASKGFHQKYVLMKAEKKHLQARDCPNVSCWSVALKRDSVADGSEGMIKKPDRWAKYDTLIFHDDEENPWKYAADEWKFLGQQAEYAEYGVKLLQAIRGKYLCLETTLNDKHIWHFTDKFERFIRHYHLRPIDVLLLVIGIEVEFHDEGKHLFPRDFGIMLDAVQNNSSNSNNRQCQASGCKNDLCRPDFEHFFYRPESCLYVCLQCERKSSTEMVARGVGQNNDQQQHVRFKTKSKAVAGLVPSLSLFTLLLAGRVSTPDAFKTSDIELHRAVVMYRVQYSLSQALESLKETDRQREELRQLVAWRKESERRKKEKDRDEEMRQWQEAAREFLKRRDEHEQRFQQEEAKLEVARQQFEAEFEEKLQRAEGQDKLHLEEQRKAKLVDFEEQRKQLEAEFKQQFQAYRAEAEKLLKKSGKTTDEEAKADGKEEEESEAETDDESDESDEGDDDEEGDDEAETELRQEQKVRLSALAVNPRGRSCQPNNDNQGFIKRLLFGLSNALSPFFERPKGK